MGIVRLHNAIESEAQLSKVSFGARSLISAARTSYSNYATFSKSQKQKRCNRISAESESLTFGSLAQPPP